LPLRYKNAIYIDLNYKKSQDQGLPYIFIKSIGIKLRNKGKMLIHFSTEDKLMAYKCTICDKKSISGHAVSHSNRKTKRKFSPNLQKINILVNDIKKKCYVCTSCIKAGKVKKA
jgi:large subunit ribosomal protein L28